jgi:carbon-monoxide dehydrogenase small subunit
MIVEPHRTPAVAHDATTWTLRCTLNGQAIAKPLDPTLTLYDALREELGLTGTKGACLEGECGSCTVIVDGLAVNSCLMLAGQAQEREILTVEGLASDGALHPVQAAFVEAGAVQCGFCTPGLLIATKALLDANPDPTTDEIRAAIAGNICRCTGYAKIVSAVHQAAALCRDRQPGRNGGDA